MHCADVEDTLERRGACDTLLPVPCRLQRRFQTAADLHHSSLSIENAYVLGEQERDHDKLDDQHEDDHLVLGQVLAAAAVVPDQPRPAQGEENEGNYQHTLREGLLRQVRLQFVLQLRWQALCSFAVLTFIIKIQPFYCPQQDFSLTQFFDPPFNIPSPDSVAQEVLPQRHLIDNFEHLTDQYPFIAAAPALVPVIIEIPIFIKVGVIISTLGLIGCCQSHNIGILGLSGQQVLYSVVSGCKEGLEAVRSRLTSRENPDGGDGARMRLLHAVATAGDTRFLALDGKVGWLLFRFGTEANCAQAPVAQITGLEISLGDMWESLKDLLAVAVQADSFTRGVDIDQGLTRQIGREEVEAAGDGGTPGGVDGLHHPYHEGHVDEHECSGCPADDKIDKNIESILVLVVLLHGRQRDVGALQLRIHAPAINSCQLLLKSSKYLYHAYNVGYSADTCSKDQHAVYRSDFDSCFQIGSTWLGFRGSLGVLGGLEALTRGMRDLRGLSSCFFEYLYQSKLAKNLWYLTQARLQQPILPWGLTLSSKFIKFSSQLNFDLPLIRYCPYFNLHFCQKSLALISVAAKGTHPLAILQARTPSAHRSIALSTFSWAKTSGATQAIVPRKPIAEVNLPSHDISKSLSSGYPSSPIRTFSDLRSQQMKFLLCRYSKPKTTPANTNLIQVQPKSLAGSYLAESLQMYAQRSPPPAFSKSWQIKPSSSYKLMPFIINGHALLFRMLLPTSRDSRRFISLFFSTFFSANAPVY